MRRDKKRKERKQKMKTTKKELIKMAAANTQAGCQMRAQLNYKSLKYIINRLTLIHISLQDEKDLSASSHTINELTAHPFHQETLLNNTQQTTNSDAWKNNIVSEFSYRAYVVSNSFILQL